MSNTQQQYKPGDIANGHVLGEDGVWREVPKGEEPKKNWFLRHKVITGIGGVVLAMVVIKGVAGGGDETSTVADTAAKAVATQEADAPKAEEEAPAEEPVEEEPSGTVAQENALRAAQDYLDFSGFSKAGLIDQLSSEYGDGFDKADAEWAVSQLDVDWNEQAVRVAEDYLEFQGFSRAGLIDQMSSDYGDKFTKKQATYAADAVGL